MYTIERYSAEYFTAWNDFVDKSKNGTFLFNRNFMEYHADRFEDFSLLVFEKQKLIAVFPANKEGDVLYSHRGLTYGGLVLDFKAKLSSVIEIFRLLLDYLHSHSIAKLHIKTIPVIYHKAPAQELEYALFLCGATLSRRDSLFVYDQKQKPRFSKTRRESIYRGVKNGLVIKEESVFDAFWNQVLIPNMDKKHEVKPVHSLEEITRLNSLFPENIRHFNVYHEGVVVAGTTVFVSDMVAHPQHISGNADKNMLGSLDYLYAYLINEVFADKKYFDFGISNEQQGLKLNQGLAFWKESYGARTIVHDFYEVNTANFALLDNVLI